VINIKEKGSNFINLNL